MEGMEGMEGIFQMQGLAHQRRKSRVISYNGKRPYPGTLLETIFAQYILQSAGHRERETLRRLT